MDWPHADTQVGFIPLILPGTWGKYLRVSSFRLCSSVHCLYIYVLHHIAFFHYFLPFSFLMSLWWIAGSRLCVLMASFSIVALWAIQLKMPRKAILKMHVLYASSNKSPPASAGRWFWQYCLHENLYLEKAKSSELFLCQLYSIINETMQCAWYFPGSQYSHQKFFVSVFSLPVWDHENLPVESAFVLI